MSTAFPDPSSSPWTNPDDGVLYFYESGRWRPEADKSDADISLVQKETDTMTGGISSPNFTAASSVFIDGHTYSVTAGELYFDGNRVLLVGDNNNNHSIELIHEPRRMWSDNVTETIPNTDPYSKVNAFNFRLRNKKPQDYCVTWTGFPSVATLTIDPPITLDPSVADNIRFWAGMNIDGTPDPKAKIKVNGIAPTNFPDQTWSSTSDKITKEYIPTFDKDIGTEVSSISWEQNNVGYKVADCIVLSGIWINGKQLVDADIPLPENPILETYTEATKNNSEVWSAMTTGVADYPGYAATSAFNGKLSDIDNNNNGGISFAAMGSVFTFTLDTPIPLDSSLPVNLRFWASRNTSQGTGATLKINGVDVSNKDDITSWYSNGNTTNAAMYIPTFDSDIGDSITTIEWENKGSGDGIGLGGIWINEQLLVDVDKSLNTPQQVGPPIMWSDMVVGTVYSQEYVISNGFNYKFGENINESMLPKKGYSLTFTPTVPIPLDPGVTDHLEIWCCSTDPYTGTFKVNGIPANNQNEIAANWGGNNKFAIWKPKFDTDIGPELTSITWDSPSGNSTNNYLLIQTFILDGKYLVDSDVVYPAPECS